MAQIKKSHPKFHVHSTNLTDRKWIDISTDGDQQIRIIPPEETSTAVIIPHWEVRLEVSFEARYQTTLTVMRKYLEIGMKYVKYLSATDRETYELSQQIDIAFEKYRLPLLHSPPDFYDMRRLLHEASDRIYSIDNEHFLIKKRKHHNKEKEKVI
jgi:hypothetical protein